MTTFAERPTREPVGSIQSLELEITGKCQLACTHCLSESCPQAPHGPMTLDDWRAVIFDAAALGIRTIQIIGGEPTVLPNGDLAGCVLARDFPVGNVRETRLGELLGGEAWAALAARIPLPVRNGCPPDDSSDCNPANTTACAPKY
ncbi:hypothetical protein ABWJ92_13010 [Streptomyces sp. NPDC000609]|uniref:hypothetical protein n=1 Tax=Streptomyces sp. NPDC000609 TaxID=3160957 RepID=UPI0033970A5F